MSAALSTLKNHIRPLVWRTAPRGLLGRRGLHQDRVLRTLVERLVGEMPVTSFVETGTHTGETAAWVASRFPRLQVYSCEIDEMWYRLSAQRLRRFRNVHLAWQGSQTFLPRLISEGRCGPLPLFFLDAHWLEDWPLRAELQAITRLPAAAVVIDDFQVPDHPQFSYCHGPVGSSREAICNSDIVSYGPNTERRRHSACVASEGFLSGTRSFSRISTGRLRPCLAVPSSAATSKAHLACAQDRARLAGRWDNG